MVGARYHDSIGTDDGAVYAFSADMLAGFTLSSSTVAGCKTVTGKLTLSTAAPVGGLPITISDTLAAANPPATVTVPAGTKTKSFAIKTVPVTALQSGTVSIISGETTLIQNLTVRPMGLLSVTLTPSTVVGSNPVTGKATLECIAGPGSMMVDLASSNAAVTSPVAASISIPQGLSWQLFNVNTSPVLSKTSATIAGTANGIKKSKTLTVTPAAAVSPTSLKFGYQNVNTTSGVLTATLYNKGTLPYSILGITLTGTNAKYHAQANNCPSTLAAGASCTIAVTFTPTVTGSKSAKLSIATSATSLPLGVSLSGAGTVE